MGARPSGFKTGGGGFLNNVDGTIVDYTLSTDFIGKNGKPVKQQRKPGAAIPINAYLQVRLDGADDVIGTNVQVAWDADFDISDDGKSLEPKSDEANVSGQAPWGTLIDSMCKNGFDENELPEDEFNWEPILGRRCRFIQVKDDKATERAGKRKSADGKREFDRTRLAVSQVYDADAKPGKATKPGKAGKGAPDFTAQADATILDLIKANGDELLRSKIKVRATQALRGNADKDAIVKLLMSDDYLDSAVDREVIVYNEKTDTLEAAA